MKVIDLLNKIANGEGVPNKIKYQSYPFELQHFGYKQASYLCNGKCFLEGMNTTMCLTDEVEIIEEEKDIEEIELGVLSPNGEYLISVHDEKIQDKINELVREVKKLKKGVKDEKENR